MLSVFSLIFNGCISIKSPDTLSLPIIGKYYHTQRVVIKKEYIHSKKRKLYVLPKVQIYKITDFREDGKDRFSIPKVQVYKAQKNCDLKSRRIKSYEDMIRRNNGN